MLELYNDKLLDLLIDEATGTSGEGKYDIKKDKKGMGKSAVGVVVVLVLLGFVFVGFVVVVVGFVVVVVGFVVVAASKIGSSGVRRSGVSSGFCSIDSFGGLIFD